MTNVEPVGSTPVDIESLRCDYDHFHDDNPELRREQWKWLRAECPVAYSSAYNGFVLLTKYEDVYNTLVDTETFTSTHGVGIPRQPMTLLPEDLDPPIHRKYRSLINPPLAPQQVAKHELWIRQIAVQLLDSLAGKSHFDVVAEYARRLPQMVTINLLGIPQERLDLVSRTTTLLATAPRGNAAADEAGQQLFGYLTDLVAEKRADPNANDLVALLTRAEIDDEKLSDDALLSMVALLLFGGLHTTAGAIAGVLIWLADHPEDRVRIHNDPSLIAKSIDEMIRFTSPASHVARVATRDTTIRGCPVHEGDAVMVVMGSGNQDPDKFDNPEHLTLGRPANHHLSFGMGPHRCVGSHLAKLQMRVALEEFMKRYEDFVVEDHSKLRYSGGEVRSVIYAPLIVELKAGEE